MKVVAFLPAKGTSQRVKNKNTRVFNGEPFFAFTLRKLLNCEFIDEVFIDSEDAEILEYGHRLGATKLPRERELATNKTDGHQLFYNEVRQVEADIYIQHLCTSPFVGESTIAHCVELVRNNDDTDSVILARKEKCYYWSDGTPEYDIGQIPNSFDLPDTITEAMSLYVVDGKTARKYKRRIGERPKLVFGDPLELIDVNSETDFQLALTIGAGIVAEEEKKLRLVGRFLSSPILSDCCDELGLQCVLPPTYSANLPDSKIFGRARTLHIRAARESDPPDSIYDALQSYKHVVSNDIIVVQNEVPEFAYFGELNMSLSLRSGAIGAIIGGVTRDSRATTSAGFPVFAKGNYCKDIKGRGAVESINQCIELDGIPVAPSDLIFADKDGIVVIPRKFETKILGMAMSRMQSENKIVSDICSDVKVEGLVEKYGFF